MIDCQNIRITGGDGFIDSDVVRRFVNRYADYHIFNLDALTYAGNLGNLKDVKNAPNYIFLKDDITDDSFINEVFQEHRFDGIIHLAAESHVDRSITDTLIFVRTNIIGTVNLLNASRNLARACGNYDVKLIHVSTDFVFDGEKQIPYTEQDETNLLGVYGQRKLAGEKAIMERLKANFILRTSWLYSEYVQNFVKTILSLGQEKRELRVVNNQIGTLANAHDLARFIIALINENTDNYGSYHYSNTGQATWYGFALTIFGNAEISCDLAPVKSIEKPTTAKRPRYSVLDKGRVGGLRYSNSRVKE